MFIYVILQLPINKRPNMYYHTLEHKYYATYSQGFHFKRSPNDICRPRAYKAATFRKDNPKWKLTDEVEADNGTPPESWGKYMAGTAGINHVPANITDKKTATAICEYLNANPEPKTPFLTPAVLDRALTALGYGTLEEYLAPPEPKPEAVKATPAHRVAPEVPNPFKPSGDPFNFNRYIRESRGLFAIGYAGVNIAKLPSHTHAVEALRYLRTVRASGLDNPKSLLTTHMATWQPLEDLA
jgi:hypothetical protein